MKSKEQMLAVLEFLSELIANASDDLQSDQFETCLMNLDQVAEEIGDAINNIEQLMP